MLIGVHPDELDRYKMKEMVFDVVVFVFLKRHAYHITCLNCGRIELKSNSICVPNSLSIGCTCRWWINWF